MSALLEVTGLEAGYDDLPVLRGLDLAVTAGGVTAVVGSNGAGKSTLMRVLAGLVPAQAGRLRFQGEEISAMTSHERVAAGIVLVPEGRLIFPEMSVADNLRSGAITARARGDRDARLEEVLALFPRLRERFGQGGGTLSGGEQQMLALGRGLMADPKLLLLDEPTLGLAPGMVKLIFRLLPDLVERGVTLLLAEQDVRRSLALAGQAYVLEQGRVVLSGQGAELLDDPAVRKAYLGL